MWRTVIVLVVISGMVGCAASSTGKAAQGVLAGAGVVMMGAGFADSFWTNYHPYDDKNQTSQDRSAGQALVSVGVILVVGSLLLGLADRGPTTHVIE
jgi:heme/copper-type cytochrome/quinol oxidase subunit 1